MNIMDNVSSHREDAGRDACADSDKCPDAQVYMTLHTSHATGATVMVGSGARLCPAPVPVQTAAGRLEASVALYSLCVSGSTQHAPRANVGSMGCTDEGKVCRRR